MENKIKVYNTLTRKKEVFKPLKGNEVKFYGCGPTVYWYQHIGNLRRYFVEDIIYRVLIYNGFKVKHIIGVTDVGHLTSNADEGEDKIEKAAKKEGKKAKEITKYYFNVFIEDLKKINIIMPDKWVWATKHIQEQIDLVKKLEKKGFTYKTSDGIYFDTSKLKNYGHLARLDIKGLEKGKRTDFREKKNKTDFALWKFSFPKDKRQQEWQSPWGKGFPGWHAECSAMSSKYLGKQFDIHTGGVDNMNPHHINEIAQSEIAFGKIPWVKYWIHNNHLNLKEGRMAKSSGKIIRLKDLEDKGYNPLEFRYFLLASHYRKRAIFDFNLLEGAKKSYNKVKNIISEIKDDKKVNEKYLKEFEKAINDDLNMPNALTVLWKLIRDEKAYGKYQTIKKMDEVFGLKLIEKETQKIPEEIKKLLKQRENARNEKDWNKSDKLREQIKKLGYNVDDTSEGQKIKKLQSRKINKRRKNDRHCC
jgi:cysteinyl-tRNA synthetase